MLKLSLDVSLLTFILLAFPQQATQMHLHLPLNHKHHQLSLFTASPSTFICLTLLTFDLTWQQSIPTQKPFLLTCHHMLAQTNLPSTCLASHSHTRACWQGMCSYLFFLSGASISLVLSLFALFNSAQESCYTPPAFVLVLLLKQR